MNKTVILVFCFFIVFFGRCYGQIVTTIAGNGFNGFGNNGIPTYSGDGGPAVKAQINPGRIASDSKGNIYIAQNAAFYTVRRIDAQSGIITTVAGNGTKGYSGDGGPATSAQLNEPRGIAFDSFDNLYIADYWNNCIRKVDAANGIITTVAGNGNVLNGYSGDGGPADKALLFEPQDIALDKLNNLYIADFNNNCIRKVDAITGIITKIAGSDAPGYPGFSGDGGLAVNARLYGPTAIKVDQAGDVYFADLINNRIRKINGQTGIITTILGDGNAAYRGDDGLAINAEVYAPESLQLDAGGNVYFCAGANNVSGYQIRKIDVQSGYVTVIAGTGQPGFNGDGKTLLNTAMGPSDLVFDKSGNLYIADNNNFRVRKVKFLAGGGGSPTDPVINYTADCAIDPVSFSLSQTPDAVVWNFGDRASGPNNSSTSLSPQHTFITPGTYTVVATAQIGNTSYKSTASVTVKGCGPVFILTAPNVFTPNGDGINEKFVIQGPTPTVRYDLNIYTRYGQLIYNSRSIYNSWDGTYNNRGCPAGVYYFLLRYQFIGANVQVLAGNVTLLR